MDGLVSALGEISPLISTLIDLIYQTGLLLLAFWLGGLALKGYKKKLGSVLKIILSLGVGFLIFFTSKPIIELIPVKTPFLSDFLALFIPVFVFYLGFILIFEEEEPEYVSVHALERLERLVDTLAEKIERIRKDAGVSKLGFDFFKEQVDSKLKEVEAGDYEIDTRKRENDFYIIEAADHKATYKFKFNVISGRLEEFEEKGFSIDKRVKEFFPYLLEERKKLAGVLILSSFLIWALVSYPGGIIQTKLGNFTGALEKQPKTTGGCLGPLELYSKRGELKTVNKTNLSREESISLINKTEEGEFRLIGIGKKTSSYQNQNYTVLLYNVNNKTMVCSVNLGEREICGCIGNQELGKASAINELLG